MTLSFQNLSKSFTLVFRLRLINFTSHSLHRSLVNSSQPKRVHNNFPLILPIINVACG